jgi:hypothetical protein
VKLDSGFRWNDDSMATPFKVAKPNLRNLRLNCDRRKIMIRCCSDS